MAAVPVPMIRRPYLLRMGSFLLVAPAERVPRPYAGSSQHPKSHAPGPAGTLVAAIDASAAVHARGEKRPSQCAQTYMAPSPWDRVPRPPSTKVIDAQSDP